jgi:hypothetical protein
VRGEALRNAAPEGIADDVDLVELDCSKKVGERVGEILSRGRVGLEPVG